MSLRLAVADAVRLAPDRAGPEPDDGGSSPPPADTPASPPPGGGAGAPPAASPSAAAPAPGAVWGTPTIVRHDAAERIFKEHRALFGGGGGLTRTYVGGVEVTDNQVLEAAIKEPAIETRQEGGGTVGWFKSPLSVKGNTIMDIYSTPPWQYTAPRADVAKKYSYDKECTAATGDAVVRVNGDPSDAKLEEFIRLGEAEHETDSKKVFQDHIVPYVDHVNAHVGDTPATRVAGKDAAEVAARLRGAGSYQTAYDFVIEKNKLTGVRHANDRHSITIRGLTMEKGCTEITYQVLSGTL